MFRNNLFVEPINMDSKEREKLFRDKLGILKEINYSDLSAFIGALYNGLPLAIFRFYPEIEKLKEAINQVLKIYEEYIEVKNEEKLRITKRLKLAKDFKGYIFAYIISVLLQRLKLISSREEEVKISEIEKLKDHLFKFDERFGSRIENDIHDLKNKINSRIDKWEIYNKIIGKNIGEPDERNFLAHSGLERNIVEIKKDDELWLRYLKDRIECIRKFCQKGLR